MSSEFNKSNLRAQMNPCFYDADSESERIGMLSDGKVKSYTEDDRSIDAAESLSSDVSLVASVTNTTKARFSHLFSVSLVVTELLGICCVATITCWILYFHGGFGWDAGKKEMNWHPVLMVAGLLCYANAALSSYIMRGKSSSIIHYVHCVALLLTFLFFVFGMLAVLSPNDGVNLVRFHTWIGICTVMLFMIQAIIGFIGLFPRCVLATRTKYLKFQVWICLLVFIISIVTCLIGNSEKMGVNEDSKFNSDIVVGNMCSLLLLLFGGAVSTLLLHPAYRQP